MRFDREFLKKLNILFVENNENIKKIFSENLDELFKKVFFVSTVFDALVLLDKTKNSDEKIDLILSESYFTDLNGVEFLSKVRKEHKNIPFIFILEDMDKQLLLNVLKYDITDCFIKPINEIDILEKIEKACLLKQEEDKIINYQNEIEEYLSLINKVAIVFMFNPNTT
ncbi:response regulator, partial [bacterium]|nr:response regulator [bacterium]